MNATGLQVVLYAFLAAASPLALASTLVVIGGPHRRVSGLAFGIGVVLGQAVACALAFALGVGGPKRLGLTVLVAATIYASTWSGEVKVSAATGYVVVATVLVWVPVVLSLVLGPRTAAYLQEVEAWIAAHRQALTFVPLPVLGILV